MRRGRRGGCYHAVMADAPPSLTGSLLIAMPTLADPNFWRSVVLVGVHSQEDGAFGLVINRPLEVELADILSELGDEAADHELPPVMAGGPVQPQQGFVLFERHDLVSDEDALQVGTSLTVSGSSQILSDLVHRRIPRRYRLLLGYAGWHPGQLELEIEENSWLVAPLDPSIVFDVPIEDRWVAALRSIGVEPGTLVDLGDRPPS